MDEEIDASPTSQKKRKKVSRRRAIKKMSTTGEDNLESMAENQNTEDTNSDYPFRGRMWQSAYLLEENDRIQFVPRNGRSLRSLGNEFRMSGPADFLSVSQLCAARASADLNENVTQWDVTESQYRKVDDAVNQFHESNMKNQQTDNSVRMNENLVDVSNVLARSDEMVTDDQSIENTSVGRNSIKRRSSVLETIISEWSTQSPVKIHKSQRVAVQLSPKFKFNRKRCKRTYRRKQNSDECGKLVNSIQKTCPSTVGESIGSLQTSKDSANDDNDFDESMNIVGNIQNLSKFFSQSCETTSVNADVTESATVDVRSVYSSGSRTSLDDEDDFLGFDGKDLNGGLVPITLPEFFLKCDGKLSALPSITLPYNFYEFDTDSEVDSSPACSPVHSSEQLLLMDEDDDLFANYQTQQYVSKEEVGIDQPETFTSATTAYDGWTHNTMFNVPRCSQNNTSVPRAAAATKPFRMRTNIFEDIDREFGITSDPCHAEPSVSGTYASFSLRPQELDRNPKVNFPGFSTVSGKQIPVSLESVSKRMRIFESATVSEDDLKKMGNWIGDNHKTDKGNSSSVANFPGFSTVSGKQIPVSLESVSKRMRIFESATVSEDDLKKMGNWIGDNHETDKGNSSSVVKFNPSAFTGFSTTRGSHIPVASQSILKKTKIFDNVNVTEDEIKEMDRYIDEERQNDDTMFDQEKPKPEFAGMGAWTGNIVDKTNSDRSLPSDETNSRFNPSSMHAGFTTARGSRIPVSSALMLKKTRIFDSVNVTPDDLKNVNNWIGEDRQNNDFSVNSKPSLTGTASTREQKIPTPSTIDSTNIVPSVNHFNSNPAFARFSTGEGKHMPLSSKRITIFDDLNVGDDELANMNHWISDVEHSNNTENAGSTDGTRKVPFSRSLFTKLTHNVEDNSEKQCNSSDLLREVTNTPQRDSDDVPKKLQANTLIQPSPMRKMSVLNSLRKWETLKENVVTKPTLSFDENDGGMSNTTSTPTSSRSNLCVTPTNNQNSYTQIGRECAAAIMEDDEMTFANQNIQLKEHTPGFVSGFMAEVTASSTPINKSENYRNRLKQRRLVEKFDDIAREDYVESNATSSDIIKVNVSPHIKSLRVAAIEEQRLSTTNKSNVKAVPSSLFVNKLASTQVNWKEFVKHSRPVNKPITHTSLTENILNVTTDNATKFKFNGWDHYSDEFCQENVDGIRLQDDIVVMMDGNCQIGLNEISTAFQCCPSVDVKLMHDKWIENHMKWIVVKLAAMERSFPQRFAGKVLTLENFMLQLKYRYEREIDRAERSAIRKICEMDDVPEKRMILYVAGITRNGSEYEVQLSDGWYSLPSILDFGMRRLVDVGRIKIGTKLVIYGASTVNLSVGCHPLDVSANVKLKIHANSTRRARWDSKLGYCKQTGPFNVSLKSVWGNGGNITKLRICVLRVYPVVYIDPKNLSDVHSEKVERRRSINEEREKSRIFDSIISQVTRDFEEEEKSTRYNDRPRKITKLAELSSITDPAYLSELLDTDKDPERIESELSSTQKSMVLDYKAKLNCLRSEEINTRVKAKLAAVDKGYRKFVPLLRFKATDETFYDKTAVVTVWKPTEEILSLIREESVFDLTGSSSRGANLSELQIYAGKSAKFQKINVATRVPTSLLRRHISISEILSIEHVALNELDATGVVVHVGESFQGLQPVFIADSSHNIVRINFWLSVKEFAYEDILQPKRFLAIKNLQWRKSSNSKPIPTAYATEHTQFMENPQSTDLSSALISLKEQFANVDLNEFIETCMEKVRSFNASSCLSTPIHSNLSSSSLQSSASSLPKTPSDFSPLPGRSSLSNQSRIELLSKYGDGMQTPPLKIDSLSKSFKLPVANS